MFPYRISGSVLVLVFEIYGANLVVADMKQALIVTKKNNTITSEEVLIGFLGSGCKAENDSQIILLQQMIKQMEIMNARQSRVEQILQSEEINQSKPGKF